MLLDFAQEKALNLKLFDFHYLDMAQKRNLKSKSLTTRKNISREGGTTLCPTPKPETFLGLERRMCVLPVVQRAIGYVSVSRTKGVVCGVGSTILTFLVLDPRISLKMCETMTDV